jgi:transcriptional regulator with XRE-family HTH domain
MAAEAQAIQQEPVLPRIDTEDTSGMLVGQRVAMCRVIRGMSQRQVGEGCQSVTYAYISRIEAGTRKPSVKALRQIAVALDVHPVWLETGHVTRTFTTWRGEKRYRVTWECLG